MTDVLTSAYKRYGLALMTAVFTVNLIDRGLINLLLEPIKRDLGLSDTQLGFVTGIAFGLFYAVAGLPLARCADKGNRTNIASAAIGLWSLTVMGCLWVGNYLQLVAARVLAAVGEAGCKPPTYSLVGDYFPGAVERTRAMSLYNLASPLAVIVAYIVGGWLNEQVGWRLTFAIMGIPGLILAFLVKATLIEPRSFAPDRGATRLELPSWKDVISSLWSQPSARHMFIGLTLFYMLAFGMGPWYAAFLMRIHGMQSAELGLWIGIIHGLAGAVGILLGGYVASRWFAANEPAQMRATAIMVALLLPLMAGFLLVPGRYTALLFMMLKQISLYFLYSPIYALLQRLVADNLRATTAAMVMLFAHLTGMGLGPQLIGALSDLLSQFFGTDSLRYAMLAACAVAPWSAYHFWRVSRTVREDLAAVPVHAR